jgi:hypothetical protein
MPALQRELLFLHSNVPCDVLKKDGIESTCVSGTKREGIHCAFLTSVQLRTLRTRVIYMRSSTHDQWWSPSSSCHQEQCGLWKQLTDPDPASSTGNGYIYPFFLRRLLRLYNNARVERTETVVVDVWCVGATEIQTLDSDESKATLFGSWKTGSLE